MPGFERLLVIGRDGVVLGEVNGVENDVLVPEGLCALLSVAAPCARRWSTTILAS